MPEAAGGPRRAGVQGSMEMVRRVTQQMLVAADVGVVIRSVLNGLLEMGTAGASVWLYATDAECETCRDYGPPDDAAPPEEKTLHLMAWAGLSPRETGTPHRMAIGRSVMGAAITRRAPVLIDDLSRHDLAREGWRRELWEQRGIGAIASYPLLVHGEPVGVLGVAWQGEATPDAFEHTGLVAMQAALAIKGSQMLARSRATEDRVQAERDYLHEQIQAERGLAQIVGESAALRTTMRLIADVAMTDTTVLLVGETGTGKELLARAVHGLSPRRDRPLVTMNSGGISPSLAESELFGHERGAFTGAVHRRIGRFELAHGGTLLLDEVSEIPPEIQVKLLHVLQDRRFERVGGSRPVQVDVRLVAASNRDLAQEVAAGRFRADLYYRLNVFPIRVPPLRERREDVPLLVTHLLARLQHKLGKRLTGVSPESLRRLQEYAWPGNVRELQNLLERAAVLARSPVIDVPDPVSGDPLRPGGSRPPRTLAQAQREHIQKVLFATGGRVSGPRGAAELLGLHPNTLRSRMKRLGIRGERSPSSPDPRA